MTSISLQSESIDKDFAAEVIEAYKFCYKISQALPVEDIGKNPVTKKFGRQFFFTKCAYVSRTSFSPITVHTTN